MFNLKDIGINPPFLKEVLDTRFPEGLTSHGNNFYARQISISDQEFYKISLIENVFEYERRAFFPHMPSRFQSVFATETTEESQKWRERYSWSSEYPLWEIEFDTIPVKLDASFLFFDALNLSFLAASYFAKKYWSGEEGPSPLWELLVPPPATVIRKTPMV